MFRPLVAAMALACAACATPDDSSENTGCKLSEADRAWLDESLAAWRFAATRVAKVTVPDATRAVFFDASCVLTSADALNPTVALNRVTWTSARHTGTIALPVGEQIPAGVTSFASGDGGMVYFAMSTPSVWSAGGVSGGALPLETLMTAVLLHEASHVAQTGPYGARLGRLIDGYGLPDDFNDDSLQRRFETDAEFANSVRRETELFEQAAAAPSETDARRLAREARALMRARAARWFIGKDAHWAEAEDVWLTFEGSGQWLGYRWAVHPQGGAVWAADADARWARGRWWSQTQGLAVVNALHRLVGNRWQATAFGDGSQTVLEMLDAALAE